MRLARLLVVAALGSLAAPGLAQDACSEVKLALLAETQNVDCTVSADLTTANPDTTPQDNSRAGLPPSAFTPRTDAQAVSPDAPFRTPLTRAVPGIDRKSTRLNSSHSQISYAVFCLKKKKKRQRTRFISERFWLSSVLVVRD